MRVAVGVGNFRFEPGKDIQVGLQRLGFVDVVEIRTLPEKALARSALDATRIDLVRVEDGLLCSRPKSSPTTAITRTSVKKLAESEK